MYKLVKVSKKDIPRLIQYKKDIIYMYSKDLAEDERNKIDEYVITSLNETFKDYYNIKSIDINSLRDKKLNTKLNFFIKIQKTENKKKEFNILGIYYYLSNNNNFKKLYFN